LQAAPTVIIVGMAGLSASHNPLSEPIMRVFAITIVLVSLLGSVRLALGGAASQQGEDYTTQDVGVCPPVGKTKNKHLQELNKNKNRAGIPGTDDIDADVTLAKMLALPVGGEGDDDRFDEKKAATIRGYVIAIYTAGKESCNCYAGNAVDQDTHMEIGLSKNADGRQRVIVEITPRLRKMMKDKEPSVDWSTDALQPKVLGKWVEFTGWLMFDWFHRTQAENTNPGGEGNWRATCWELHPVTSLKVLGDTGDVPELAPAILADFQAVHARAMKKEPYQDTIKKRNEKYMSRLSPEELKERDEEVAEIKRQRAKPKP
jgi:hypothetical protein